MILFGRKRDELLARANKASRLERENDYLRGRLSELRHYVDSEMKKHFAMYNGGLSAQMQMMSKFCLPTPWVPVGVRNPESPIDDSVSISTMTYVRESRMVPLREAGRI